MGRVSRGFWAAVCMGGRTSYLEGGGVWRLQPRGLTVVLAGGRTSAWGWGTYFSLILPKSTLVPLS